MGGRHRNPRRLLEAAFEKWEDGDSKARRRGLRWAQWARAKLDEPEPLRPLAKADIRSSADIRTKQRRSS